MDSMEVDARLIKIFQIYWHDHLWKRISNLIDRTTVRSLFEYHVGPKYSFELQRIRIIGSNFNSQNVKVVSKSVLIKEVSN